MQRYNIENSCVPSYDGIYTSLLDCDNVLHGKGYKRNTQTISFTVQATVIKGDSITLSATASSGLPVTFSVSGPGTISGSTLTVTDTGTISITATQVGNNSYLPAIVVQQIVSSSKFSTLLLVLFIIMAILLFAVVGYYIYQRILEIRLVPY